MAKEPDPIKLLAAVPLFEDLSRKDLQSIARSGKEVTFAAGKVIVEEGATGVAFHLILSGEAKVTVKGRAKATLSHGDYFGEISLIDRGARTASVTAMSEVTTLTIASWAFLQIVDSTPALSRKLLQGLCRRLRESERTQAIRH